MRQLLYRFLILFAFSCALPVHAADDIYNIGILMWHDVKHDQEAVQGFVEGLEFSGLQHNIDLKNAAEDLQQAQQFLIDWEKAGINLIFTVGTTATLLAQQHLKNTPIVFSAVTSPITSGIINSWHRPGGNATGTSNWVKLEDKLRLFKQSMTALQTLGVIYNPQNPVSVAEILAADQAALNQGIKLKKATISGPEQIQQSIQSLIDDGIDALWVPIEKDVYTNMHKVGEVSIANRLPVFSSTMKGVEITPTGESVGIVGITVDYHKLGHRSVYHAIDILTRGTDPGMISVETLPPLVIANLNSAATAKFKIPPLFLARSDVVISGFDNQKITISGTGDSQKLLQTLARELIKKLKGGEIVVPDSIGSSGGIRAVASGRTDLARTARPLRDSEKNQGLTSILFARSPVVFVVHPSVTGIDNLSTQDILDIYSAKKQNWADFGSVDNKIYAVTREPGDSSLRILSENLPGFRDLSPQWAKTFYNTPDTIRALKNHRFTIGFTPYSEIINSNLRVMKLNGFFPSADNIQNGNYPLTVPLSIVYKHKPGGLGLAFMDFLFSEEGKKIIAEFGAIPAAP